MQTKSRKKAKSLDTMVRDFARKLRKEFSQEITGNPRDFKKQVIRLVRRELPLRRGRPNDPRLDAAFRLVQQGRSVSEILRSQLPTFETMDAYSQYLAGKGLRAAIARRRRSSAARTMSRSDPSGRLHC